MIAVDDLPRPFGPYVLLSLIARGGMGEVYLAKHGGLQGFEKVCVVKTLRPELANEEEYLTRFTEEARVVVQLSHRNVCTVFDVGRVEGQLYLAMEHVVGRDLRAFTQGPLPPPLAIHIVSEVLEALDYAHRFIDDGTEVPGHALGIVHRDVSPHNILLGVEGDVKLIDFGIASTARVGPLSASGTVLGKISYMSPEHARGDVIDGRSDQYAAAVVLAELLLGEPFFVGFDPQAVWRISGVGGHRPPRFGELDEELRTILDRALDPDRLRRFATASDFGEAIVGWARRRGQVADARDLRRFIAVRAPHLERETRELVRAFFTVRPPVVDATTPGFETIATTLMTVPTTSGMSDDSTTFVLSDRRRHDRHEEPAVEPTRERAAGPRPGLRPRHSSAAAASAVVVALAAGVAFVSTRGGDPLEQTVVPLPAPPAPPAPPASTLTEAAPSPRPAPPVDAPPADVAEPVAGGDDPGVAADSTFRTRRARFGADTRRDLAFLASGCAQKVTCAPRIIEWSRRNRLTRADRQQIAESAADCARQCRLR